MEKAVVVEQLGTLRSSIDNIDAALVHILAERFRCTESVGYLKAEYQLPPSDPARERFQIERLRRLATESGLNPDFVAKFLRVVIDEVIARHQEISQEYEKT